VDRPVRPARTFCCSPGFSHANFELNELN